VRTAAGTRRLGALICLLLLAAGCGRRPSVDVHEVAAALREHGINYEVEETAALASLRAEGLRLAGPALVVELYSIPDEKKMELASRAAGMAQAAARRAPAAQPLKAYVHGPLLVIVRREPEPGRVAAALGRILTPH